MKIMTYTSIVIYINNNEKIIADFLLRLDEFLNTHFSDYEIILVNDHSDDNTIKKIYETKNKIKGNVMIVDLAEDHGIDRAMAAGVDIAIGDFIYEMEMFSIDINLNILLQMHKEATEDGYDIVFAKLDKKAKLSFRGYSSLIGALSKKGIEISNNPIRLVTRRVLNSVAGVRNKDRYLLFRKSGFRYLDISCSLDIENRNNYQSISSRAIKDLESLILYTNILYKIPFVMSIFLLLSSLVLGLYNIYGGIFIDSFKGHNWLYSFLLLGFSISFFILGIICKYLDMMVKTQSNMKDYRVQSLKRLGRE